MTLSRQYEQAVGELPAFYFWTLQLKSSVSYWAEFKWVLNLRQLFLFKKQERNRARLCGKEKEIPKHPTLMLF